MLLVYIYKTPAIACKGVGVRYKTVGAWELRGVRVEIQSGDDLDASAPPPREQPELPNAPEH